MLSGALEVVPAFAVQEVETSVPNTLPQCAIPSMTSCDVQRQ